MSAEHKGEVYEWCVHDMGHQPQNAYTSRRLLAVCILSIGSVIHMYMYVGYWCPSERDCNSDCEAHTSELSTPVDSKGKLCANLFKGVTLGHFTCPPTHKCHTWKLPSTIAMKAGNITTRWRGGEGWGRGRGWGRGGAVCVFVSATGHGGERVVVAGTVRLKSKAWRIPIHNECHQA